MSKKLARIGDKTTYGNMITATSNYFSENKQLAQSGDLASCSKCKGVFPVQGTANGWINGSVMMIQDQDRVLCGCSGHKVFATSYIFNG